MINSSASSGAWKVRLQNIWQNVSQTSRESWQLTRACCKPSSNSSSALSALSADRFKTTLLEHAQMSNQVAVRILLLEKEWSVFKYYGAYGYLQRKWSSGPSLPKIDNDKDGKPNHEQEKNNEKEDETAKIAFMITARMKQQLQEELGYNEALIKSMTPLQASLVLNHRISLVEYSVKLPQVEEDYRIQQERKIQKDQERRTRQVQQEKEETHRATMIESISTESSNAHQIPPDTPLPCSPVIVNVDLVSESKKITWYEVIQSLPNGEETKLGLYRTPEEAQEGIDALQYIAEKRQKISEAKLSIRPSLR